MGRQVETGTGLISIQTHPIGEEVSFKHPVVHTKFNGPGQGLETTAYIRGLRRRRSIDLFNGRLRLPFFSRTELIR